MSVEEVLMSATGLNSLPPSELEPSPRIEFLDDSPFPMANTCCEGQAWSPHISGIRPTRFRECGQKRGQLSQDKKSESLFSLLYWPPIKPAPPSAPKHQMRQPLNRGMIGPIKAVWAHHYLGEHSLARATNPT